MTLPKALPFLDPATIQRFWSKIDKNGPVPPHRPELGPCWVFTAAHSPLGYGAIFVGSKRERTNRVVRAHRVAWEIANGPPGEGLIVLHGCDNPPCCNHSHLCLGTHADNVADKIAKGRIPTGSSHWNNKLSQADVEEIRRLRAPGPQQITGRELASRYGVSQGCISMVANGLKRAS